MTKLNKTEKAAIQTMVKTGFTFYGDNFTNKFNSAKRCLNSLMKKGFCTKHGDEFKPTSKSHDFIKYGIIS